MSEFGHISSSLPLASSQSISSRGERTWNDHLLAPWWSRVLARTIDGALVAGLAVLTALATHLRARHVVTYGGPLLLGSAVGLLTRTPGRRLMGIRVVSEANGTRIGLVRGVVRELAHLLDAAFLGLGYLWPLWDERAQTFADKLVRSVVVMAHGSDA